MSRFNWSGSVVKKLCGLCSNVVRFERTRMTAAEHCIYLTKFCELLHVSAFDTALENLIMIKLGRLRSTRAGACIIQILQELEMEPALHKIKKTGRVSN